MLLIFVFLLSIFALSQAQTSENDACFGQASAVFAQMGEMGDHSSSYSTPRLGLANLARLLFGEPDMEALGQFVANSLKDENGEPLTIDACLEE